jgi:hypothetical protein
VNRWGIVAIESEVVQVMLEIATRDRDELRIADWLREHALAFVD